MSDSNIISIHGCEKLYQYGHEADAILATPIGEYEQYQPASLHLSSSNSEPITAPVI